MSPVKSKRQDGQTVSLVVLFMLAVIIAVGVFLRGQAFLATEVVEPLQAGSADAYALAQTLSSQGAYKVLTAPIEAGSDADSAQTFGSLGYPLFLSLFATPEAGASSINAAVIAQLVLGVLAILLVFMLTSRLMDPQWALTVAFLTAVSPSLVNISLYLVSATLLMIAMLLYLVTAAKISDRWAIIRSFIAAALLGIVAWVDPTYEFLILPWLVVLFMSSKGVSKLFTPVAAILGFALVFGPFMARNQEAIETPIATAPIVASIQQGMPPAQADDAAAPVDEATSAVAAIGQVGGSFIDDPRGFLKWYFVEKPKVLWSLGEPAGVEQTFVYPVAATPYTENPIFLTSEEFMHLLYGPVALIGVLGAILVWLPAAGRRLTPKQRIGLRSVSLVLIYATLAKVLGTAAPQYATPLMPLLFVMALTPLYLITAPRLEAAPKKASKSKAKGNEAKEEAGEAQPEAA
ncbi:hypothetical protein U5801_11490 [Lamprobacter modestohalophilus]|uniref:hypothetical protein n=1 Tax=Lamprobacter modestohalophilus TaxID=1064514 RepID=UPI002ADEF9CC|nr:hypothetical protein [Lamprobacter modestohalophilus]MEA1050427.1 hypothetical protein [Lamprobacter modestohalophilus]